MQHKLLQATLLAATLYTVVATSDWINHLSEMAAHPEEIVNEVSRKLQGVDLTNILHKIKEDFHDVLPGHEPYSADFVPLECSHEILRLNGVAENVSVSGLSDFRPESLLVHPATLHVNFSLLFPRLDATGLYDVQGELGEGLMQIFGNGSFSIILHDLRVSGYFIFDPGFEFLSVKKFNIDTEVSSMKVQLENFLGGGEVGAVTCAALSEVGPEAVKTLSPAISDASSQPLADLVNARLHKLSVKVTHLLDRLRGL